MSAFNPDAPAFIPTFLRRTGSNAVGDEELSNEASSTSAKRPLVFLIFGCRGAGKTTQSELLAKEYNLLHISSGNIYRQGKQPFVELRRVLLEEFGEGGKRRYNGLVLDRFVVNSEFDAFYIQSALDAVKLPVPFVFMLAIDAKLASKRAESREDNKTAHQYWRVVEQKAQAVTLNTIYAPIGCLKTIRVTEDATIEDVFGEIKATIGTQLSANPEGIKICPAARHEAKGMKLIDDYETYMELVCCVHAAVGNVSGRKDTAPLSGIGAYLDREYFSFGHKNLRSLLSTFHVTLKADGQRYLLVKHKRYGYIGFPAAFTHCYDFNKLFDGVEMSCGFPPETQKFITDNKHDNSVEVLLDTELVIHDGNPVFYVLDYLYLGGLEGKKMRFVARLKILREFFGRLASVTQAVVLKDYVPINMLRTLLPKWKEAKMPIDGLVFQHSGVYKIGRDRFLVKWKPIEHCTVDFRLANGILKGDSWTFELMVTDDISENGGFGEIPYEGALAIIPSTVVQENGLCNGIIVELALKDRKETNEGVSSPQTTTWWSFRCLRNDKPSPNKHSIVKKIVDLRHLSLEELVDLCEKVPFYGNT
ncbi:RNA capping enzyme, cytoplasmic [Trypanosoma cruzi]|uniref:RNA guanylyltransferase, putative n=2 Tax=Trypanosoma cruzi TaxID=5693 RepID=Q4DNJ8_TRYCC|nr:RNA guanylyltransferase, putative [Trypanosoma cruzi]EAN94112.1 RNA guanylyltransferase, putative [Trypanosoma cruzi]PWV18728.1 RNA capping enzyme, cytoplasmic [Trypanosoma cruzi]RNC49142.1 RNA guanylyltransferase [Trypanosoma cruzi]|eukprot:XP_815963.1 RNA guanylyltransferase [Trypanosoma cruzi strain CL Brener]